MKKSEERLCRNCRFYPMDRILDKAGRVLKDRVAFCAWIEECSYAFPSSITSSASVSTSAREYKGQSIPMTKRVLPTPRYMGPNEGADCECFEPRPKTSKRVRRKK